MKKFLLALPLLALCLGITSCKKDDDEDLIGNWVKRSDFEGIARSDASVFVIDDEAYVCSGYEGKVRMNDMWKTDGTQWTQLASLPDNVVPRASGVAFAASQKGYFGLGYDGDNYLSDFYCYDPANNSWTQLPDFEGGARYGAVAFSLNDVGYVGCGYNGNCLKDFYSFDPQVGTWAKIPSILGSKRHGASAFVIGNDAYVVGGTNNGSYVNDFYKFNGSDWIELRKISNVSDDDYDDDYTIVRAYGVAFVINGKGYFTCGENGALKNDTWEYNPGTDVWEQKTNFEGASRTSAVGFSINNRGYVATGSSSSYRFDDMYEFYPNQEYDEFD